jgi:hypothetical protein
MAEESRADPLLVALMKLSRLPWYWATALVAFVLLLFLILAGFLEGVPTDLLGFWRVHLDEPVMITYILVLYPFMWRLHGRAIQAFRPLLPVEEDAFNRIAAEVSTPSRRWEWVAVLVGAAFSVALAQPWSWPWSGGNWLYGLYMLVTTLLLFSLLAWLIYDTLFRTLRLARLSRQDLKLDIFDTGLLAPISRWSLGISLVWVGGVSLSLVFQTWEGMLSWQTITIYAILVLVTVLVFFLSMWSTHSAMAAGKKRELAISQKHLAEAYRELKNRAAQSRLEGMEELSSAITAWATTLRQVREAPAWPFNPGTILRLAASIVVAIIIFVIRVIPHLLGFW